MAVVSCDCLRASTDHSSALHASLRQARSARAALNQWELGCWGPNTQLPQPLVGPSLRLRGLSPTCQHWWWLIIHTPSTDFRPCPVPLPANTTFQINYSHTNTLSQGCFGENKSNASWAEDWWQSRSHLIPSSASSPNTKQILENFCAQSVKTEG